MANQATVKEAKRVGKFGAVGIINTLIDVTIYNVLSGPRFALTIIQANFISTTIAMIFSFFANRQLVFQAKTGRPILQAVKFLLVTAFGLYVLQSGVIKLFTEVWTAPLLLAVHLVKLVGLGHLFSDGFLIKNGAKVAAIMVSLVWNYTMYKKVVFKS